MWGGGMPADGRRDKAGCVSVTGATRGHPGDSHGKRLLTEETLERILEGGDSADSAEPGPVEGSDLAGYLLWLLDAHSLRRAEVIRRSGVNATFAYQIFQGARHPGREKTLQLAFGIGCNLCETQRLLRLADHGALWQRDRRDAIIIFCLEHRTSLGQCNDELYRLGERTLGERSPESGLESELAIDGR
jgi:hypothetical protein